MNNNIYLMNNIYLHLKRDSENFYDTLNSVYDCF